MHLQLYLQRDNDTDRDFSPRLRERDRDLKFEDREKMEYINYHNLSLIRVGVS